MYLCKYVHTYVHMYVHCYICTNVRSYYYIPIGIPPVENLMVVDHCTSVIVSWDITDEGPCRGLSYNVSLTSLDDGVKLQSMMTNDNSHTFSVEPSNERFSVSVSTFNKNATGPLRTTTANVNAPNG